MRVRTRVNLEVLLPAAVLASALLGFSFRDARGDARPDAASAISALPGPAPRVRKLVSAVTLKQASDVQRVNEECASCHAEIAEEWRSSLHRQAWVDPVFQKAYAIENVAFCRSCHAPEADPASEPGAAERAVGVGCTTCHMQAEGVILAARRSSSASPHPVMVDARLATTAACASCHQFDFPGEKMPMQDTVHEHARSSFASTDCQACHMPLTSAPSASALKAGDGRGGAERGGAERGGADTRPHKSHRFSVIGDPAVIRSAAVVTAARPSARALEITVAPGAVGHSFPTGDMFRRLEVRAEAVDEAGSVIARAEPVFLGRTFGDRPRDRDASPAFHRVEVADTRVLPPGVSAGRVVAISFAQPVGSARVRWRVLYQRMGSAMAASFGVDQAIDEVLVAEGTLPPGLRAPRGPRGCCEAPGPPCSAPAWPARPGLSD